MRPAAGRRCAGAALLHAEPFDGDARRVRPARNGCAALNVRDYRDRWSTLHGGQSPAGLVGFWVRLMHVVAEPFAVLRVPPAVLTVLGVLVATSAPAVAWLGEIRLAAVLIVIAALLDGLDGAVAVLTHRTSRGGAVLDVVCDRISDLLVVLTLWFAGAPGIVCAAAAAAGFLHEYLREALRARGFTSVVTLTLAERPMRLIIVIMFLLGLVPTAGAWTLLAVSALGPPHLVWALRRLTPTPLS